MQQRTAIAADHRLERLTPDAPPARLQPLRQEKTEAMAGATRDVTRLPNWMMPIVCSAFVGLLSIVYFSMQAKIDDLKQSQKEAIADIRREYDKENTRQDNLIDKSQTFIQNTREWLKEHGYDFDDNGRIVKRK